jgi:uracil-DNA glycosylase family 4
MSNQRKLLSDAKQWIEQERVWDDSLYVSTSDKRHETSVPIPAQPPEHSTRLSPVAGRLSGPDKGAKLKALYEQYKDCTRCPLGHTRIKIVFGVGNPNSEVLLIGEGPGYEEDRRGEPFVGKAGQLLDKMLAAIQLSRQTNAYIANIVKCHPLANPLTPEARGNDRAPNPDEVAACSPILLQQILIMKPRVIVTLGSPSTKMILQTKDGITGLRGKFFPFPVDAHYPPSDLLAPSGMQLSDTDRTLLGAIQVLPTYHPAALLRNPNLKPESWTDLKLLRETLTRSS